MSPPSKTPIAVRRRMRALRRNLRPMRVATPTRDPHAPAPARHLETRPPCRRRSSHSAAKSTCAARFDRAWQRGVQLFVPLITQPPRRHDGASCRSTPATRLRDQLVRHRRARNAVSKAKIFARIGRRCSFRRVAFDRARPSPRHGRRLLRSRAASTSRSHARVAPAAARRHRVSLQQVESHRTAPWDVALDMSSPSAASCASRPPHVSGKQVT